MGVFTRVRDIIQSNINSMLDKAEDPEKLVRLMIREMEDTLVEIKASCAQAMATKKRLERQREEVESRAAEWAQRAQLAVDKGREDLAREALVEKRRYAERVAALDGEAAEFAGIIDQYRGDIAQIEGKLATARDRQRVLVQRHNRAQGRKRAQEHIRRFDTSDALVRFDKFESRIDRMEAEADLVNYGRTASLDDRFAELERDDEIENELSALKDASQEEDKA